MSDPGLDKDKPPASTRTEQARHNMEKAEAGNAAAANALVRARDADPADTEAAEQEALEGPEGRGLSR